MPPARPSTSPRRPVRGAVLALGVLVYAVSVGGWVLLVVRQPHVYWQQTDMLVYRDAGLAVRHRPAALYAQVYGEARQPFTYPPFAALLFAAAGPVDAGTWRLAFAAITLAGLPVAARSALTLAGLTGTARWAGTLLVAAVGMWLEPVDSTLHFGQVNVLLLALTIGDLALPDRIRYKGAGVGLAAAVKLTPLIFVGYLLVTRRWRAAAVAGATMAATVAFGFVLLPRASAAYWTGRFARPGDKPDLLVNQSLNGAALRLLHDTSAAYPAWLVAAAVVAVVGLAAAGYAGRRGEQLLAVLVCATVGLLVSPVSWTHHWVWVAAAPALAVRAFVAAPRVAGRRMRVLGPVGAVLVVALVAWWPLPTTLVGGLDPRLGYHPSGLLRIAPHTGGAEQHWTAWQLVYGDSYVLVALVFVVGTAVVLVAGSRHAVHESTTAPAAPGPGARQAARRRPGSRTAGQRSRSRSRK